MIKAAYKGWQLLGQSAAPVHTPKPATPEQLESQRQVLEARVREIARIESEAQVIRWLDELDRASGQIRSGKMPVLVTKDEGAAPVVRNERFLYLLSVTNPQGPKPQLQLEAMVSYPKVAGGWAKAKPMKFQPEKGQPIYDLATPADHDVLQLMRAMPSTSSGYYYSYGNHAKVTPDGHYGAVALEKAASTGRLFVSDGKGQPGPAARWGPPLNVRWEWHEVTKVNADEGSWALRARLEGAHTRLCLNNPPFYLDPVSGQLGLAEVQGMTLGQVAVLLKTPPLKAQALKKHQGFLRLPTEPCALDGCLLDLVGDRTHDFSHGDSLKLSRWRRAHQRRPGRGRGVGGRSRFAAAMVAQLPGRQPPARGALPASVQGQPAPLPAAGPELAAVSARPWPGRHPGRRHGPGQNAADPGPHPGRKRRGPPHAPRAHHCAREPDGQLAARSRALLPGPAQPGAARRGPP
jgi:hypothetical protein